MRVFLITLFLSLVTLSFAQPAGMVKKANPYKWMLGVSWSFIDDNGEKFTRLFDLPGSFHFEYYPSKFTLDRYIRKGWSFEATATYNKLYDNKQINLDTGFSGFLANVDVHLKYSFNRFFKYRAPWFDPYISMGLGATYRTANDTTIAPTFNTSFGVNFWMGKHWGIQLQTTGKLALNSDIYNSHQNYLQHNLGVMYRFTPKKKSKNHFNKSRHNWINKNTKYNRKRSS